MKWLLLLIILAAVVLYLVYRYRKHLQTAWFMYKTFRRMRSQASAAQKQVPQRDTAADTELLQCPKCGKWSAKEDAVKLKSHFYCSLDCLEESVAQKAK